MGLSKLTVLVMLVLFIKFAGAGPVRKLLDDPPCDPCYSADKTQFICCSGGTCGLQGNVPTCTGGQLVYGSAPGAQYTYLVAGQVCSDPDSPNACFEANGGFFTCCASQCAAFSGTFPTCAGGAPPDSTVSGPPITTPGPPANNPPGTTPSPPVSTPAPPVSTPSPPVGTPSPPVNNPPTGGGSGSTATPMVNGACAPGLNPCYISDGSRGFCCATSCELFAPDTPMCFGDTPGGPVSTPAPPGKTPAPPVSTPALPVSAPPPPVKTASSPPPPAPYPTSADGSIVPNYTPGLVSNAGSLQMLNPDVGISAMHGTPVPYTNRVLMIDRTDPGPSKLFLPGGGYAYAGEFDLDSNTIRAISVPSNTWCSAGSYRPDGTIINNGGGDGSGGFLANSGIRSFNDGGNLQLVGNMSRTRWYPSSVALPDGRIMFVGGEDLTGASPNSDQASYEFYPSDGNVYALELLSRSTVVPAHLYPFLHLMPDGRMFVFAATESVLLDYGSDTSTNLPVLPGNLRQYPVAGASVLLPFDYQDNYRARVMVCGGGTTTNSDPNAPASNTCGTIAPLDAAPGWTMSTTPSARVMGYLVLLLDGTILYINGGTTGFSGYFSSNNPNFLPSIYDPTHDTWQDMNTAIDVPRMYHACAYLIPDGRVILHGSNPMATYNFTYPSDVDRTQTSVESYSPWYIGAAGRPTITALAPGAALGATFTVTIAIGGGPVDPTKARVAIINPGFATHTITMSQRYVRLALVAASGNTLTARLPASANVLPPGPYLCTVLYLGIPSPALWFKVTAT